MSDQTSMADKIADWMGIAAQVEEDVRKLHEMRYTELMTVALFAQAVAQPHGVNEETPPDYEQMAKDALAKATETAPYLLKELGLLPKETPE